MGVIFQEADPLSLLLSQSSHLFPFLPLPSLPSFPFPFFFILFSPFPGGTPRTPPVWRSGEGNQVEKWGEGVGNEIKLVATLYTRGNPPERSIISSELVWVILQLIFVSYHQTDGQSDL